eukprot:859562-Pelagomonas_calceolata.AAC.1
MMHISESQLMPSTLEAVLKQSWVLYVSILNQRVQLLALSSGTLPIYPESPYLTKAYEIDGGTLSINQIIKAQAHDLNGYPE